MNLKSLLCVLGLAFSLYLTGCSGVGDRGGGGGGGGGGGTGTGNAAVSVSISDTTPSGGSVLSFTMPIIGISLVDSSGKSQALFSSTTAANVELTRLQTDSDLIASSVSVPAGTYTAVNVTVAGPTAVLANTSGSAIGTCAAGTTNTATLCQLTGIAGTMTFTFPTTSQLVLTSNQKAWIDLDFNYNNAVTSTGGIDITQAKILKVLTSPAVGVSSGNFANVDDFVGAVQSISGSSITVQSNVRGTLTATITSTTPITDPQGLCTQAGLSGLACVKTGSIVSVQAVLSDTGGISVTNIDILDTQATATDEVEGIIYPSSCNGGNNYGMILSDAEIATTTSPLFSAAPGTFLCLTLNQSTSNFFAIDYSVLTNQPGLPTGGFGNANDILFGQVVRARISGAAAATNVVNATANSLVLRFSRVTATVNTVSGNNFSVTGLPPYITITGSPLVGTYTSAPTLFEGVTSASGLSNSQVVSFSALYLNNSIQTFPAVKVRLQ